MSKFSLPLVIAFVAALSASPVVAQGNGNGNGRGSDKKELRDNRDRDRDDDDEDRPRFERRRTESRSPQRSTSRATQQQRRVPPGWCQGRGNPHNTPENCRYNSRSREWERFDTRSGRWEDRDGYERNESRYGDRDRGSYDQAHRDFHYSHDRQCRERAAQRPLDLRWQVQVRSECKSIHDDFHRRWGTPHR